MENVIPEVQIPVIAAGGISDGRAVAAALIMGAAGVQMGSRFLLAEECQVHSKVKQAILDATDTDTVITGFTHNSNVRGLKNAFSKKYLEREYAGASSEELASMSAGTNRSAAVNGDIENGFVQVGMSLNRLSQIQSASDIVLQTVEEARSLLKNGPSLAGAGQ